MKVIGIRTAPKQLRFAILEIAGTTITFVNQHDENIIKVPVSLSAIEDIIHWQKSEVDRILRQNKGADLVAIKTSEFARTDTKSSRMASYLDAAAMIASKDAHIPVCTRLYSQIATKRKMVKAHAEQRVGSTNKYWNEQIADAICVAFAMRRGI